MQFAKKQFNRSNRLNLFLFLGYGIVILLMTVSLIITLYSTRSVRLHSQNVLDQQLPQMLSIMEVEQQLNISISKLNGFIITGDEQEKINFHTIMAFLENHFDTNPLLMNNNPDNAQSMQELFLKYRELASRVIDISDDDLKNYQGIAKAAEFLNPKHQQFVATLDSLIDNHFSEPASDQSNKILSQLIKTKSSWLNMIMGLRVYFSTRGDRDLDRINLYKEQSELDIQKLYAIKSEMGFDGVFVEELLDIYQEYMEVLPLVLEIYSNDTWRMDTYLVRNDIYPITNNLDSLLTLAVDREQHNTSDNITSLEHKMNNLSIIALISFAISLLIGLFVIHVLSKNIKQIVIELDASRMEADERSKLIQKTSDKLSSSLEILKKTQHQLVENEKMAALGNLVAGMAHEINTPIGIGVTASSHINDKTNQLDNKFKQGIMTKADFEEFINDCRQSNSIMLSNLRRAAELVGSFKQVAVDQSCEGLRSFELCEYLKEVYNSLIPKVKKTQVKVAIDCTDKITMNSYPGAVAQVVTNLIMNSLIHGFNEGSTGQISISAAMDVQSRVTIIYKDNGKGMDQEALKKIFDPFYTTKRGQGGSGLGMHLLYNLITQKLSGTVEVTSEPGSGISFFMMIPLSIQEKSQ